MKNPSMEETIFDAVLTRAFADAFAEELAEMERDCPAAETADYPEKYRKIERKAYRKRWGGGFRLSRGMKRAAAWILAVGITGGVLVMAVPEVRAGFNNLVATAYEKYTQFESANKNSSYSINTGEYIFEYIPNEYMQTSYDDFISITYTFESKIYGRDFTISYVHEESTSIYHDNEHTTFTQCSVNGNAAYYIQNESGDWSELLWHDGFYVFSIYGTISEEMMMKIAENIVKIE